MFVVELFWSLPQSLGLFPPLARLCTCGSCACSCSPAAPQPHHHPFKVLWKQGQTPDYSHYHSNTSATVFLSILRTFNGSLCFIFCFLSNYWCLPLFSSASSCSCLCQSPAALPLIHWTPGPQELWTPPTTPIQDSFILTRRAVKAL